MQNFADKLSMASFESASAVTRYEPAPLDGLGLCGLGPEFHLHDLRGLAGCAFAWCHRPCAPCAGPWRRCHGDRCRRPAHAWHGSLSRARLDVILTPIEMFDSAPPNRWPSWSRVPGQSSGDPLTLATIALARGSRPILVT